MTDTGKKAFLFGCDYEFLPLGVRTVHSRLKEALKKADLSAFCGYAYDTLTWCINCYDEDADKVYEIFYEIVSQIVMREFGQYDSESENEDNDKNEKQKANIANKLVRLATDSANGNYDTDASDDIESGVKALSFSITEKIWSCESPNRIMDLIIPLAAQEQIASLTSSLLVQDLNMQKINITSHSEADSNRVLRKLDTLSKRYYQTQKPIIQHVFYAEKSVTYQISVRSLLRVKPELAQKTLINKEDLPPGYGKIHVASVLRFCALDQYRSIYKLVDGEKIVALLSDDEKDLGSAIWIDYKYPKKGEKSSKTLGQSTAEEVREVMYQSGRMTEIPKTDQIEKWMANLPKDSTQTTMKPFEEGPVPPIPGATELVSFLQDTDNFCNPRGFSTNLLDTDNWDAANINTEILIPRKKDALLISRETPKTALVQESQKENVIIKYGKSEFMKDRQDQWAQTGKNSNRRKPTVNPSIPIVLDPTNQFIMDMKTSLRPVLSAMRTWHGDVRLEAQFGRILIRNAGIRFTPGSERSTSWDREEIQGFLMSGVDYGYTEVNMTKIITSAIAEERYLLNMKDDSEVLMWQIDGPGLAPSNWTVIYEFKCQVKSTGAMFIVEVDAESFATRVKTIPTELGVVNVHCLLRNWDYRVVATVEQDLHNAYGHIADIVVSTLFIPENLERPTLMFEIHENNDVNFRTIRTVRSCRYHSTDGKSVLKLKEVYDMKFSHVEISNTGIMMFEAWAPASKIRPQEEPFWLEVSISSTKAEEKYLSENRDLELGDETRWTEEDMIKDEILHVIYLRACQVVKNMDRVGAYNDNGWRQQPKQNATKGFGSAGTVPTKRDKEGYW